MGINPEVENIHIAVILIGVEMDDVIAVASQGNILFFKENNLYYWLQLKAIVFHKVSSMLTAAVWAGLDDLTPEKVV